jgi:hypothetical protein
LLPFTAGAQKETKLFNGKNLSNWNYVIEGHAVPGEEVFTVNRGLIHVKGTPKGYIYTKEKYGDYRLHVEWRWVGRVSNSGIFLLVAEPSNPFPNGIECQLGAGDAGDLICEGGAILAEYQGKPGQPLPKFAMIKKANPSSEKPTGEWNEANIFVRGGVITVYVNGVFQNMGTNTVQSGYIGLQSEGGPLEFRNVYLVK